MVIERLQILALPLWKIALRPLNSLAAHSVAESEKREVVEFERRGVPCSRFAVAWTGELLAANRAGPLLDLLGTVATAEFV
jgi:hypothetical protein